MRSSIQYTKRAAKSRALGRMFLSAPMAEGLAEHVRHRVEDLGRPLVPFRYSTKGRPLVSPRYPAQGGKTTKTGARVFESSHDFHRKQGVRAGHFKAAGGMWRGQKVLVSSRSRASVQFRGRSEGQRAVFRRYRSGAVKARGRKVSNALKAASILRTTGVNVLYVSPAEQRQLAKGVENLVARTVASQLPAGVKWRSQPRPSGRLATRIFRANR